MSVLASIIGGMFDLFISSSDHMNQTVKRRLNEQTGEDMSEYYDRLDGYEAVTDELRERKKEFDESHRD
ncbi:MAG: hypothetical protein ACOYB8_07525 [Eubacteriaceae bacterium]|jgi:hypothetical protein